MVWFSKPKHSHPQAPALCARCRERLGTRLVHFVAGPDGAPLDAAKRTAWLCDPCQKEVRREAGDN